MALHFYKILATLAIADISLSQRSMDGKTQTFKFEEKNYGNGFDIYWIFQNGNRNITLFLCSSANDMRCDASDDSTFDLYSANMMSNSSSIISVFTIKHVSLSLHNTRWFYIAESYEIPSLYVTSRFDLQVFHPAESSTCDEVKLLNESNIQIYCWTNKVFPGSLCLLTVKTNVSLEYEFKQGHVSYTQEQNLTTLYYQTTCTLVVSAAILGPGSHKFRVVMYPNITSDITEEMKSTSEYTRSIYLGYPRVFLGTDCEVQGYIPENKQSSCTCMDISNSFLPTHIYWLTNSSIILEKGTLIFTAKRRESFQCIISNHLNWTDKVDFRPNISYPPDSLTLNITKQFFDLCNNTNIILSGTCFVSDSNPEPLVTVNINNFSMDITPLKPERQYIFYKTMTSAGIYNISCLGNSKEYSKNVSSITTVTITGPSGIPNIFKPEKEENKSQPTKLLKIKKGDTITCESKGGYPKLKNISLTCGPEETSITNKDQVSMALTIPNITSGKCECIVWQESNCLQNTSSVQFQFIPILNNDSTKFQLSDGAFSGIVIAGIVVVATIALIIFLVRRSKGKCLNKPGKKNQSERNNYNQVMAAQYANTEMHTYESLNIQASYINILNASSKSGDKQNVNLKQATTQYVNTELCPYETADCTESNFTDAINDTANRFNNHEYNTANGQEQYCYDEIDVETAPGSA
ncbi:unnamed protein product [Lymnaea stagnalis]|uniref:Ig-like domain-containing protein n=1 Tax=Lymnaea stagnalis TaxID=6523 RepID=A0AAV2II78_LYMST